MKYIKLGNFDLSVSRIRMGWSPGLIFMILPSPTRAERVSSIREEEREMAKLCREDNIVMTPYSTLAGGRLSKAPGETSKWLQEDDYARLKYDGTAPVVGATKLTHVDGMAKAADICLTKEEIHYLEEPYVPHRLAGARHRIQWNRQKISMSDPRAARTYRQKTGRGRT